MRWAPKSRSIRDGVKQRLLGNLILLSVKPLYRVFTFCLTRCHGANDNIVMISSCHNEFPLEKHVFIAVYSLMTTTYLVSKWRSLVFSLTYLLVLSLKGKHFFTAAPANTFSDPIQPFPFFFHNQWIRAYQAELLRSAAKEHIVGLFILWMSQALINTFFLPKEKGYHIIVKDPLSNVVSL